MCKCKQISHIEANQLINECNECDIVIADVRNENSYKEEHITNAIHLPKSALQEYANEADKETAVLVYCYHGAGGQSIAQYLVKRGFRKSYSLIGSFTIWKSHHAISSAVKDANK